MNDVCCQKDCEKPAEWEIYADAVPDTLACTDHVGELLTDAKEHRIFRLKDQAHLDSIRQEK